MKKTLALLLSILLIFTSFVTVIAEEGEEEPTPEFYSLNLDLLLEEGALPEGVSFTYDETVDLENIPANTYFSLIFDIPAMYDPSRLFLKVSPYTEFVDYDYSVIKADTNKTFLIYMDSDKTVAFDRFDIKMFPIDVIITKEYAIRQCEPYDENDPTPFQTIPGGKVVPYGGTYWFKVILAPDYSESNYTVIVNGKALTPRGVDADGNRVYRLQNITAQPVFNISGLMKNQINNIFSWFMKIMKLIQGFIQGWFNRHPVETTTVTTTEFTTDPEKVYYSASMPPVNEAYTVVPLSTPQYILEGSDFKFKVEIASGYIGTAYVYINGVQLLPDEDGIYVVEEVMDHFSVSVKACVFSIPASSASFTITLGTNPYAVEPGGSFVFSVVKNELITGNVVVKANGTIISPTSGNTYTISNINGPIKIEIQVVSVTLPGSMAGIYTVEPLTPATNIPVGGSFSFRITKNVSYLGNFVVKANGQVITPSGNTYTVTNINGPVNITIGAYLVKPPAPLSTPQYSIQVLTDPATLGEGGVYRIKITRLGTFTGGISVLANGSQVEPSESDATIYEIPITRPTEVIVQACSVVITGLDNPIIRMTAVSPLEDIPLGGSFSFQVAFVNGYDGEIEVKANDKLLTPNASGVYTVYNITGPVTIAIRAIITQTP